MNHHSYYSDYVSVGLDFGGKFLEAETNISSGEIILNEEPIIAIPKFRHGCFPRGYSTCLGCYNTVHPQNFPGFCSICSWPVCSPQCAKVINAHGENECQIFAKNNILPNELSHYEHIGLLRCLLLKQNDKQKWSQIIGLLSPSGERLDEDVAKKSVHFIRNTCMLKQFDPQDIKDVASIIWFNLKSSYSDFDGVENSNVGYLYNKGSHLRHSCFPNSSRTILNNGTLQIKTLTTLKPGDKLTTPFKALLSGTHQRRLELERRFRIRCRCKLCSDPSEFGTNFSGIICSICKTGVLLPIKSLDIASNWSCNSCSAEVCATTILQLLEPIKIDIEAQLQNTKVSETNIVAKLHRRIQKYEKIIVHSNHYLLYRARNEILLKCWNILSNQPFMAGTNNYLWKTFSKYLVQHGLKCLEVANKFWPGETVQRGRLFACILFGYHNLHENTLKNSMSVTKGDADTGYIDGMTKLFREAQNCLRNVQDIKGEKNMSDLIEEIAKTMGFINGETASTQ